MSSQVEAAVSTDADVVPSVWVWHLAHCFAGETLRHIAAPTMKTEGPMWQFRTGTNRRMLTREPVV